MNIVVDYGNSSVKLGIFKQDELISKQSYSSASDLQNFLQNNLAQNFLVSSVKANAEEIMTWTDAKKKFILEPGLPLPIKIQYKTPSTLGVDRIAGVCGAQKLYPSQNVLVIDAGTCITYDFIDSNGSFMGGGISPGLQMRFQAMHTFTARLPLIKPSSNPVLIGSSTEECIRSGGVLGLIDEIEGIISRYKSMYPDLRVILCGGDGPFFENQLKASIFACPELVLLGLNSILLHNVAL
jgi:type III pantothenate kinase